MFKYEHRNLIFKINSNNLNSNRVNSYTKFSVEKLNNKNYYVKMEVLDEPFKTYKWFPV
jgi:hypothetical protein